MEATGSAPIGAGAVGSTGPNRVANLNSEDFFRLLITELRQQDPLEPMDNAKLLEQIASVREIELNTTLTKSLQSLTGNQRFASASSLIGQVVTAEADDTGDAVRGVVVGVRFGADAAPVLQLADGREVPLEQVRGIEPALKAAEALIGQKVAGVDRRDPSRVDVVEGIVTGVRKDALGEVVLELDTGKDLRFRDVLQVSAAEAA